MRSSKIIKNKFFKSQSFKPAFTIIELIVVAVIITTLSAIVNISYNSWRQNTVVTQLKSDLSGVASAMENYRTFNNIYPTQVSTISSTFATSSGVTLSGGSSDGGLTYCVSAVNSNIPSIVYHIDSTNAGAGAQTGNCSPSLQVPSIPATLTVDAEDSANWSSVTCVNSSPVYVYSWFISGFIDISGEETSGTSFETTTSIDGEYSGSVSVAAKCVNGGVSSPLSGTISRNYVRR